jgi:hypothetical protein
MSRESNKKLYYIHQWTGDSSRCTAYLNREKMFKDIKEMSYKNFIISNTPITGTVYHDDIMSLRVENISEDSNG